MSNILEIETAARRLPAGDLVLLVERLLRVLRESAPQRRVKMPDFEARMAEYCKGPPLSAEAVQGLLDELRGDR